MTSMVKVTKIGFLEKCILTNLFFRLNRAKHPRTRQKLVWKKSIIWPVAFADGPQGIWASQINLLLVVVG